MGDSIHYAITEWLWPQVDQSIPRNLSACLEELGEVAGAINKRQDGRTDKPKTLEDTRDELAQLLACVFLLGMALECPPDALKAMASEFSIRKARELAARDISPWREVKS